MTFKPSNLLQVFRGSPYRDPTKDWILLIAVTGIILMVVAVWAAWVFTTVSKSGVIGTPAPLPPRSIDNSALTVIRDVFETRTAEEAKFTNGTYHFSDPSQ